MTVQGVPLFYPFLRNPCVLPGNPNARFKTGNLHSETMIFCFFLLSLVFLQPLFKNGFWTQYNRYFGTPKHLASEFHKSPDALNVKYTVKKGTEIIKGEGICISASDAGIVLLEENGFHFLNKEKYTILEVMPEHIGKQLLFQTHQFIQISTDSLNHLINKNPIKFIEVNANQNFKIFQNNIHSSSSHVKLDYPNFIFFQEEKKEIITSTPTLFFSNPRIKTIQLQIDILKKKEKQIKKNYSKKQTQLDSLKSLFQSSKNIPEREAIYQKIKQFEKTKPPVFDSLKIQELEAKLLELQKIDSNTLIEKNAKTSNLNLGDKNTKTKFTGTITYIVLI